MKRIKKKYVLSLASIIIPIIVVIIIMNGGYSMWTTKLNISGRVLLEKKETKLEVFPVQVETGRYINYSGFMAGEEKLFVWDGDMVDDNNLSSNISVANSGEGEANISISFKIKNNSSDGISYSNGTIIQDKKVDSSNAILSNSYSLSNSELRNGDISTINLNYNLQREKITNGTYIKYIIKYETEGNMEPVPYYYYYTLYISP